MTHAFQVVVTDNRLHAVAIGAIAAKPYAASEAQGVPLYVGEAVADDEALEDIVFCWPKAPEQGHTTAILHTLIVDNTQL
jgi:hypothetical protein